MKLFVQDANVIFDLFAGGLVDAWFSLGYEVSTTSFVLNEITDHDQRRTIDSYISEGILLIVDTDDGSWNELVELSQRWRVSIQDASVALLARSSAACLLTGDNRVRKKSAELGIEVRGTLWILDHLLEQNRITRPAALDALLSIENSGTFLPREETARRKDTWCK